MQKTTQFDDRIRNLIALAQEGSKQSRTLLFSHISDLFLQERPMASAVQVRMLTEILKELLGQVDLSTRLDVAAALLSLNTPPEALINMMCEDVVEVSGPLLEKAILPDEKLIHIIRYGTEAHRIHVSRRFGLSPLVRHELETAFHDSKGPKQRYSLNELHKVAEDQASDHGLNMDEDTTANILELLRAQNIHQKPSPAPSPAQPEENLGLKEKTADHSFSPSSSSSFQPQAYQPQKESDIEPPSHLRENDFSWPDSTIVMEDISSDMIDDIRLQVQDARQETMRHREFIRTVADWFWEIDRMGNLSFISEDAFTVFGRTVPDLIGEDFISLCLSPETDSAFEAHEDPKRDEETQQRPKTFEDYFEHRASFRHVPFFISAPNEEKTLWYISAIAIFDSHSGRFTGFRGSASASNNSHDLSAHNLPENSQQQEKALEDYITTQALKAAAKKDSSVRTPPSDARASHITQGADPQSREQRREQHLSKGITDVLTGCSGCHEEISSEKLQNLSHEFRTPLNAIIGFSEMIDMEAWGPVNAQYHQNLKNILSAAGQLKEAVNDVLDSAKLEAGLMQIQPESFSLKTLLKDCLKNVADMASEKHVQLMHNDNNIDVILYNDKQSIELCLTKMLMGTLKKSTGYETISPSVLINSNAQVRVEIPILGPKIMEKNTPEMFQKLKSEPDDDHKMPDNEPKISSGFGLSIAQSLAHAVGGDILIHSSNGYATHLVLSLSNYETKS